MLKRFLICLLVVCLLPVAAQAQLQDQEIITINLTINEYAIFTVDTNVLDIVPGMPPAGTWISTDSIYCTIDASIGNGSTVKVYSETDGDFVDPVSLETIILGSDFTIRGDGDFVIATDPSLIIASQEILDLGGTGTYTGNLFMRYWDLPRIPGNYSLNWTLTAIIE